MAIGTDAAHKQMDAAIRSDLGLIGRTLLLQIGGIAVENVYIFGGNVDMREEIAPHEAVVALRMVFGNSDVFIHVEGHDMAERDPAGLVEVDQFLVRPDRGRAGRQTEYERFLRRRLEFVNPPGNVGRSPLRHLAIRFLNDQTHKSIVFNLICFLVKVQPHWRALRA